VKTETSETKTQRFQPAGNSELLVIQSCRRSFKEVVGQAVSGLTQLGQAAWHQDASSLQEKTVFQNVPKHVHPKNLNKI
jgi:hypothetical protein